MAGLSGAAVPIPVPAGERSAKTQQSEIERVARITIRDFSFSPPTLTVQAGTKLVWTNEDADPHTVQGVGPSTPIASQPLDTGDNYLLVIRHPGKYEYFCTLHPRMVGMIIVQ